MIRTKVEQTVNHAAPNLITKSLSATFQLNVSEHFYCKAAYFMNRGDYLRNFF